MNKVYSIIWSICRQTWIVAHESASRHGKQSSSRKAIVSLLLSSLIASTAHAELPTANTLPTDGQVTAGQASISQTANTLNIDQTTDKAVINWNTFSIGSNATVNFVQPNSTSVALNRVLGADPSYIFGRLNANGQVFLINANGVLFGEGARVDVGGLVASTLNIKNSDFLAGNYQFSGGTGSVVNQGELLGKYVALLAPEVRNQGVIVANLGTVVMAGGTDITLNLVNNQLIDVAINKADINTLVENKHLIQADAGTVILSAQSASHLLGKVVNSGDITAKGITAAGGKVRLTASSEIEQSGSINVDAGTNGNGGSVIVIASLDAPNSLTTVTGSISARGGSESGNGGFVETSASQLKIASTARIDTRAPQGLVGQWLLDPYDFTIAASGGDITGADLSAALNLSNVTIQTTNTEVTCTNAVCGAGDVGGNGDIFVNDEVSWSNPTNSLTLDAWRDIIFNASVKNEDVGFGGPLNGNIFINYGAGGAGKAVIKQGVDWGIGSPNIVDNVTGHNSAVTAFGVVNNTSRDFWVGTKGINVVVQQVAVGGVYGNDATVAGFFDAAGGNQINISAPTGSVTWDASPATLNVAGSPYSLSYVSGLSSDAYSGFAAGNAGNYTVTARPITLAADDRTKTFGDVLVLGGTAFTLSSGTLATGETITNVTLASVNGYDASTTQVAGTYNDEVTVSGPTGGGGFDVNNYAITFDAGDLTINPVVVPPVVTPTTPSSPSSIDTKTAVSIVQYTSPNNQNTGVTGLPSTGSLLTTGMLLKTALQGNGGLTSQKVVLNEKVQQFEIALQAAETALVKATIVSSAAAGADTDTRFAAVDAYNEAQEAVKKAKLDLIAAKQDADIAAELETLINGVYNNRKDAKNLGVERIAEIVNQSLKNQGSAEEVTQEQIAEWLRLNLVIVTKEEAKEVAVVTVNAPVTVKYDTVQAAIDAMKKSSDPAVVAKGKVLEDAKADLAAKKVAQQDAEDKKEKAVAARAAANAPIDAHLATLNSEVARSTYLSTIQQAPLQAADLAVLKASQAAVDAAEATKKAREALLGTDEKAGTTSHIDSFCADCDFTPEQLKEWAEPTENTNKAKVTQDSQDNNTQTVTTAINKAVAPKTTTPPTYGIRAPSGLIKILNSTGEYTGSYGAPQMITNDGFPFPEDKIIYSVRSADGLPFPEGVTFDKKGRLIGPLPKGMGEITFIRMMSVEGQETPSEQRVILKRPGQKR